MGEMSPGLENLRLSGGGGKIRLGVPQSGYNIERNVLGSLPGWARLVRPMDACRVVSSGLYFRSGLRIPHPVGFRFSEPFFPRVDLLHFFNSLAWTRTPWITTFEHCLPRWERRDGSISEGSCRAGLDLILGDACRHLIAFSDASRNVAARDWERRFGTADAEQALAKVSVLLPPQPILSGASPRSRGARTLFAFIGGDLYRKGGLQVLQALDRLYRRGIRDWDAVIVGRLGSFGDYASGTDATSKDAAKDLITRMSDRVTHHERMPGSEVMALLSRSDYYLFPTLADTFGYSALEAMANGAVVVATNVRAMAEIIDDEVGWSIRLPLDADREIHGRADFPAIKSQLVDLLAVTLERALEQTSEARLRKAEAAVARLRHRHDPEAHATAIERIYRKALG